MTDSRRRAMPVPTEHEEQAALVTWAKTMTSRISELDMLYAIPNAGGYAGGYRSNALRVQWMLDEGVRPGYPDLGLDVARGDFHGLRIELKRRNYRPSDLKPEQKAWHRKLTDQDFCVVVCAGWEEARDAILRYLGVEP